MAKYEKGDIVTYYFVLVPDKNTTRIQAWTDEKGLAEMYMEFHKCGEYKLRKVTATIEEIAKILEENNNDEIHLANIVVRNRDAGKHDDITKLITIPATDTELVFISEDSNSYMASRIDYGFLDQAFPYLKPKYQRALHDIMLDDIIKFVIYGKTSKAVELSDVDQLSVMVHHFPDSFE